MSSIILKFPHVDDKVKGKTLLDQMIHQSVSSSVCILSCIFCLRIKSGQTMALAVKQQYAQHPHDCRSS